MNSDKGSQKISIVEKDEVLSDDKKSNLKLVDINPLDKKLETVLKENYRPVSLLPVVSKIFERIMEDQMKSFNETHLPCHL